MSRNRVYPPEFRQKLIELVASGRSPEELAKEFEPSAQTIRNWVKRAEADGGKRREVLTSAEREELTKLRRELKQVKLEREILAKATTWASRRVYANRNYEPYAVSRDAHVTDKLQALGIAFRTRKDQVIFELDEVRTKSGEPFSVFTPYRNAWLAKLEDSFVKAYPVEKHAARQSFGLAGVVRGPHRIPAGGRGHAAAQ
jgi:transposase